MRTFERRALAGARSGLTWLAAAALLAPAGAAATTAAQSLQPSSIGPDSSTRLTYTITADTGPITAAGFTNTLPASVTVALARPEDNRCGGLLSAPAGASVVSWSSGRLAQGESCQIIIYVTSATAGSHSLATFDLNASDGATAFNAATLTVDATGVGFTRSFSPASVGVGDRVTMTYMIDNTGSGAIRSSGLFTDVLPAGAHVASPANITTNCTVPVAPTITAPSGSDTVSVTGLNVSAGSTCTASLDVLLSRGGDLNFLTTNPLSFFGGGNTGYATAQLPVTASTVSLVLSLPDETVSPGQNAPLRFRLVNASRVDDATNVAATVDLDAALSGLVATGLPLTNVCGTGSSISGTSVLTVSGATLTPESPVCEFDVDVVVPAGAVTGQYPIGSSALSGDLGAAPFVSAAATALLSVAPVPQLIQSFATSVVGAGQILTISYTLTNPSATSALTSFDFADSYGTVSVVLSTIPAAGSCGAGSTFGTYFTPVGSDPLGFRGSSLNLPPGGSCTISVGFVVPAGARTSRFASVIVEAAGTVDGAEVDADVTSDVAQVIAPPALTFALADPIVAAGGSTTLTVGVSNDSLGQLDADEYPDLSGINFSLGLNSVLTGLSASGLPAANACGAGSSVSGGDTLALANGSLAAGQNCSFAVTLDVPAGAASGLYALSSSALQAQAFGAMAIGAGATQTLQVGGIAGSMRFGTTPVAPGDTVTVTYTLTSESPTEFASSITVQHDVSSMGSGYAFVPAMPPAPCGAGSTAVLSSANRVLTLSNASLVPGATCTFAVDLTVSASSAFGDLPTTTSLFRADFGSGLKTLATFGSTLRVEDPGQPRDLTPANLDEPDPDGDGVTTADEQAAGDINGDGIADAIQSTVASLISPVTGRAVALSVDPGCGAISSFSVAAADTLPDVDGVVQYPEGVASFTLPCATATVTLTYPGATIRPGMVLRKYGPQAPDFGGPNGWYTLPGATINRVARTVTYTLTDGALGDSTGVDGQIVDPVGLGLFPATGIPASGRTTMLMMALGIVLLGSQHLRNRRR